MYGFMLDDSVAQVSGTIHELCRLGRLELWIRIRVRPDTDTDSSWHILKFKNKHYVIYRVYIHIRKYLNITYVHKSVALFTNYAGLAS